MPLWGPYAGMLDSKIADINNAGAGGRHLGRHVEEMEVDDWDIIVRTHLRSSIPV